MSTPADEIHALGDQLTEIANRVGETVADPEAADRVTFELALLGAIVRDAHAQLVPVREAIREAEWDAIYAERERRGDPDWLPAAGVPR